MRAIAHRAGERLEQNVAVREHSLTADEPKDHGGDDAGPSPQELLAASLASCTAITVEMYAERKGWDVGRLEVEVETTYDGPVPARFDLTLRIAEGLEAGQIEKLLVIAGKCPVHKALAGDTAIHISESVEPVS